MTIESNWKNNSLLQSLDDKEINQLEKVIKPIYCKKDDYLIKDGTDGDEVFLITEGSVDIKKDNLKIAEKHQNEHVGFMALVDNAKRSADVIAAEDTLCYSFKKSDLLTLEENEIYVKLLANHIKNQQSVVRNMNKSVVHEMKQKLAQTQKSLSAGSFIIAVILFLVFYQFLLGMFLEFTSLHTNRNFMDILNPSLMVLLGVASFIRAKNSGYPLSDYGLNLRNWKKNITESLIWTAGFIGILIFIKWILIQNVAEFQGKSIINFSEAKRLGSLKVVLLLYGLYALLAPVQEFIARGVLQSSFEKFLEGKNKAFFAIILSNLMFSAFHIHMDIRFALLTLIPGIFWGIMYHRQKSLLGVSISHILIGEFVLLFMGIL